MLLYMDKYLDKNNNSNKGLDNICNRTRNLKDYNKERNYNEVLTGFKQMISHRILKFNPKKINDNFDANINSLWFQYILHRKQPEEYVDIYNKLNINCDE